VLGQFNNQYLRHDGPEHVLCFAPTRTGKGLGLVIPTLLTWPDSAIVHDIKGENWTLTASYRSSFSRVPLFDPPIAESAAYNPLLEVRRGVCEVRDVQNVADVLVDPEGSLEKRNHWETRSLTPDCSSIAIRSTSQLAGGGNKGGGASSWTSAQTEATLRIIPSSPDIAFLRHL
jgi:hypothetical protein